MKKKTKIILIVILIIVLIGGGGVFFVLKKQRNEENPYVQEVKVTNEIAEYGYTLEDRDTEYFKEGFQQLQDLLNDPEHSVEEYINLVSRLYITDLYTISNKMSKYDIGGLEYVYEPARESFKSVAMDTIYKNVINNLDNKREQKLPTVSKVEILNTEESTYTLPDKSEVKSYEIEISWQYESDLGYDNQGTLILIENDKKYDVVSFEPDEK